jgi:GTP-binding protein
MAKKEHPTSEGKPPAPAAPAARPSIEVRDAQFLAAATSLADLPAPLFTEVAFAGRSNVGKSSLLNMLTGRKKLVRTSNTPGATRALVLFRVSLVIGGAPVSLDLADLPGYGFAKRSKNERRSWGPMIETFLERRAGLGTVVVIVDARRGLEDDDRELLAYLAHLGKTPILVATKIDKATKAERKLLVERISKEARVRVLAASAETGEGREAIWSRIAQASGIDAAARAPHGGVTGQ